MSPAVHLKRLNPSNSSDRRGDDDDDDDDDNENDSELATDIGSILQRHYADLN